MNNQHLENQKIVTGLLIGIVGAGALYYICAAQQKKTPVLKKIGRTIVEVGEMIENSNLNSVTQVAESLEHKLPDGTEILNNLSHWISTGISLWKKMSK